MRRIVQYHQRLLELDPIALWLQDEKVGGTSYDWVRRNQGGDQDGAYTGVTLGQPGIGDGRTSPFFDGVNDFTDVFTATLQGRFNGSEGTVLVWARVFNAGVWADGSERHIVTLWVDINNRLYIKKRDPNQIQWLYVAGGTTETRSANIGVPTDWFCVAMTWSISAGVNGEVIYYVNGVQDGPTSTALGAWVGNLDNTRTVIGAINTVPSAPWHGHIAHAAVWDRALTPSEVNALYTRSF